MRGIKTTEQGKGDAEGVKIRPGKGDELKGWRQRN